jgi:predicted nucleic acid-binding protein
MLAIDTNVVVRYLTGDHPEQSAKARRIIDSHSVFVATTVLLEVEWVLRSARGYRADALAAALAAFAGLPTVTLENPAAASSALDAMVSGLDFADALHRAAARDCEAFVTFDQALVKSATRLDGVLARTP